MEPTVTGSLPAIAVTPAMNAAVCEVWTTIVAEIGEIVVIFDWDAASTQLGQ